jgi:hypothetical protein
METAQMSKTTLLAFTLALTTPAVALAQPAQPETLIGKGHGAQLTGWYLAPSSAFTTVDGRFGNDFGLRGVLMLNERFGIGLAGHFLATTRTVIEDNYIRDVGAYGGLYLQYTVAPSRLVHAYADLILGSGGWCSHTTTDECDERTFAVIEPTVNVELNLAPNCKLALGVGYRQAITDKGPGLSGGDLSGVVARTSIVLGAF